MQRKPPARGPRLLRRELRDAAVIPGVARQALYADLMVLGQHIRPAGPDRVEAPARESAHAVSAAVPFLRLAKGIHLALADDAAAEDADALEGYLRLHGVQAPLRHHAAVLSDEPGAGLLSLAADRGADLLVMGCYGHSRARELVLGGASRTVLNSMTVPVLMAH